MYEEAFFHLLRHLHDAYRLPNLSLAGGCAMNSVANGKVTRETPFRRLYVQAAAGDAGGAIGAAYSAWHRLSGSVERFRMEHAYLGPRFEPKAIARSLDDRAEEIRKNGCRVTVVPDQESLCRFVAEALAEGKVVGWFQGRMEWGARALGNRSILGDPRRADMRDLLNRKIKRRESFRPFAPSILRESVSEWFEVDEDVPFMSEVHPLRAEKLGMVPAVTHVDGSGRLQTVTREANPRFHCLLEHFRAVTGVPMLLNTSFNENEPIVCRPDEALDCFLRTHMDLLVIDDHLVERVQPE
jgi:carbamoyltransferase